MREGGGGEEEQESRARNRELKEGKNRTKVAKQRILLGQQQGPYKRKESREASYCESFLDESRQDEERTEGNRLREKKGGG